MSDDNKGLWTKAEYDQCPELAGRLHSEILNLREERDAARSLHDAEVGRWVDTVRELVEADNELQERAITSPEFKTAQERLEAAFVTARNLLPNPDAVEGEE